MITGKGRPVYEGIAIGPIRILMGTEPQIPYRRGSIDDELGRWRDARDKASEELRSLYERTLRSIGKEASIIDVQSVFLEDEEFIDGIESLIRDGADAASAVRRFCQMQESAFSSLQDDYIRARAADMKDISDRLIGILTGRRPLSEMPGPGIIVADDLTPSQTIALDKDKVLAFVTRKGSCNSHTAILARVLNIPSIVLADIDISPSLDGRTMIADGYDGSYFIDPDEPTLRMMEGKKKEMESDFSDLEEYRGRPCISKDGRQIMIYANISSHADLKHVIDGDADGIGLLRSEFLYLGRQDFPSEDELFSEYRTIAETLGSRRTIIRTLDAGSDKKADYFGMGKEPNPALGMRGIRYSLSRKDVFLRELRAICRAAAYGNVAVMFPMITCLDELLEAKALCRQAEESLRAEGVKTGRIETGVMIETPAAAIISDILAKEADFLSVGTNDLMQYTLAADRENESVSSYADPRHEAMMRLMRLIADNARKAGIWAGVCGEAAADEELAAEFVAMGYDELSVAPMKVLRIRRAVCKGKPL